MSDATLEIRAYSDADEHTVIELWEQCGLTRPWNNPRRDIRRKLAIGDNLFLVACLNGRPVGTVMTGYEGHRGWINYLGVSPAEQRRGIARQLMDAAERLLRERGCPKINLQVRQDNEQAIAFYEQIGYLQDRVISFGKRLEHD